MMGFKSKLASGYYVEVPPEPNLPPRPKLPIRDTQMDRDRFCIEYRAWLEATRVEQLEYKRQVHKQLEAREQEFTRDLAEHLGHPQGEALVRAILAASTEGNPLNRFISTADESDRLVFVTELAEHLAQAVKGAG